MVMKNRITMSLSNAYGPAFGGHRFMVTKNRIQGKRFGSLRADNYPARRKNAD
jgi:hypothetical protein